MRGVALCLALWAAPSAAQSLAPRECDPGDPQKCSQPLLQGQAAPFAGQLLTPKLALDLGQKAAYCEERLQIELRKERDLAVVQKALDARLLEIEREGAAMKLAIVQKALDQTHGLVPPPAWYERPPVVAAATATGVLGLLVVSAKVLILLAN